MKVTIELIDVHKIQNNIEALERVIRKDDRLMSDDMLLSDILCIPREIQARTNFQSTSTISYYPERFVIRSGTGYLASLHPTFPMSSTRMDAIELTMDSAVNLLRVFNSRGLQASMELA